MPERRTAGDDRSRRRDAGRPRGAPVVEAVLDETLRELAAVGIDGLSVGRIAQRAGVNKTTVYRRWGGRDELVAAALGRILDDYDARTIDTGDLRTDLLAILAPLGAFLASDAGKAVARAALSHSGSPAHKALSAERLRASASGTFERGVPARAQARGQWREGADWSRLIFMLVGALIHRALLEHGELSPAWVEELVDQALLGVLPRELASRPDQAD